MRYRNVHSGIDVDLGKLDDEKRRLFEAAYERFSRASLTSHTATRLQLGTSLKLRIRSGPQ